MSEAGLGLGAPGARGDAVVCAVVVHHRGQRLLDNCLRSLLASTGVRLEIVIVANACPEALPSLVENEARIHVVESRRPLGFSTANNLGATWARDHLAPIDHLFFVNNDTLVEPRTLARLSIELDEHPQSGIVGPLLMIWGARDVINSLGLNLTRTGQAWDEGIGRSLADYHPLPPRRLVTAVTGAALMVRLDVYDQLGGWEDLYAFYFEDIDLCLRAREAGWDVVVVTDAVMTHAISATAARGSDMKRQLSWRNRFLLMLIHWPWPLLLTAGAWTALAELKLVGRRVFASAWPDLGLQVRSWLGALERWPKALAARSHRGGQYGWVAELKPHGSVPVIMLPEASPDADLSPSADSG
jgi:N-acetylglucosaminyl-diphospho-decaprenol L-rhamnosyltransferase